MKLEIVAIRDQAADCFSRPFFVPTTGMAVRSFMDEANREAPDNEMHRHPEDYALWHLGSFDDSTGRFYSLEAQVQLALAKDLKA